jgi:accessory gene regulator B
MIMNLALKITSFIEKNSDIKNNDDLERINYSLQTILSETLKIVILIILFLVLGKINYFLFSMTILFSIRIFSGGYHSDTTLKCLLWSSLFFLITSLIGPLIPKSNILVYYIIALFSITVIFIRSPYPNRNRPIKIQKRRWYYKFISTFFMIFWITILLFSIKDSTYLNCGFLTILLQILQLTPKKKGVIL